MEAGSQWAVRDPGSRCKQHQDLSLLRALQVFEIRTLFSNFFKVTKWKKKGEQRKGKKQRREEKRGEEGEVAERMGGKGTRRKGEERKRKVPVKT